jgi:hypothetical protein
MGVADFMRLVVYTNMMKNNIAYRLFTVAVYTAVTLFIALVANGIYHEQPNIEVVAKFLAYYSVYWYALFKNGAELIPDVPSRVLISAIFVAAVTAAHVAVSGTVAVIVAVALPVLALGFLVLFSYVVNSNN